MPEFAREETAVIVDGDGHRCAAGRIRGELRVVAGEGRTVEIDPADVTAVYEAAGDHAGSHHKFLDISSDFPSISTA